ncbi:MAG: hypothetical protein SPL42_01260 [Bacteroidales bacterium]|nr:hypothetical protein [Bacteroidales bacterium]
MSDTMAAAQRHCCMSHIHNKDTKPELKVRRWLWRHGYRSIYPTPELTRKVCPWWRKTLKSM